MIGRRELFRRAIGAGAAAATLKPSDLIAAANKGGVGALVGNVAQTDPEVAMPTAREDIMSWQVMDFMEEEVRWARTEHQFMDFDIQNKKSWSPAYKSIVYCERQREIRALRKLLEKNEKFLRQAVKMLGIQQ